MHSGNIESQSSYLNISHTIQYPISLVCLCVSLKKRFKPFLFPYLTAPRVSQKLRYGVPTPSSSSTPWCSTEKWKPVSPWFCTQSPLAYEALSLIPGTHKTNKWIECFSQHPREQGGDRCMFQVSGWHSEFRAFQSYTHTLKPKSLELIFLTARKQKSWISNWSMTAQMNCGSPTQWSALWNMLRCG